MRITTTNNIPKNTLIIHVIKRFNNLDMFERVDKCMILGSLIPIQYRFSYIKDENINERVNEVISLVKQLSDGKIGDKTLLEMYGTLNVDCYLFGNDTLAIDYSLRAIEICERLKGNPKADYIKYTADQIL